MYTILVWLLIYGLAFYYARPYPWLKTLLLLYLPFCIADARPSQGVAAVTNTLFSSATTAATTTAFSYYAWVEWCRSLKMYRNVAQWFPVHLIKTVELDPTQRYIFLYHPHGVISMGANTALSTNGCHFSTVFPGITRFGVTLNVMFWAPLFREWLLALGFISANKATLVETLQNNHSIVLVPGGAAEALHAHKTNFRLHLQRRRGFVQLAMETHAHPVPCLGFGENEAFDTLYVAGNTTRNGVSSASSRVIPSALLHYWQQRLYQLLRFSTPILTNLLPNRTPIHVVVGAPVVFRGTTVDECHREYLTALQQLYDQHKATYGYHDVPIEFV